MKARLRRLIQETIALLSWALEDSDDIEPIVAGGRYYAILPEAP